MTARKLQKMTNSVAMSTGLLRAREEELDRALLNSPAVIAQRVEVELIKKLKRDAPWLLPMVIK